MHLSIWSGCWEEANLVGLVGDLDPLLFSCQVLSFMKSRYHIGSLGICISTLSRERNEEDWYVTIILFYYYE